MVAKVEIVCNEVNGYIDERMAIYLQRRWVYQQKMGGLSNTRREISRNVTVDSIEILEKRDSRSVDESCHVISYHDPVVELARESELSSMKLSVVTGYSGGQ